MLLNRTKTRLAQFVLSELTAVLLTFPEIPALIAHDFVHVALLADITHTSAGLSQDLKRY